MLRRLINRVRRSFGKGKGAGEAPEKKHVAAHRANPPATSHPHQEHRPAARHGGGQGRHERPAQRPPVRSQRPEPVPQQWSLDRFVVPPAEGKARFHDLDLPASIMRGVDDLGFKYCSPVQASSLPIALTGRDVACQAQTGTGKTAAFLIAMFARFLAAPPKGQRRPGRPRALVLAPTRELVVQILEDAHNIGRHCGLNNIAVFGGMDYARQRSTLTGKPVDLIAATPGRLLDFKQQGQLDLSDVEILVIDEADRMLDMGFIPDIKRIIHGLPPREKRQTLLFSATLSEDVLRLASQWMVNPAKIKIEPEKVTVDALDQIIYAVSSNQKFPLLVNLLQQKEMERVLVFVNRRDVASSVCDDLEACGIKCGMLSGSMPQEKRLRVLDGFRGGNIRVLVATDVAARGIHVDDVSHVINYDIPYEAEDYVHRTGRTARVGKVGTAITFACEREAFTIPEIEKYIGRPITCKQPEEHLLKLSPALVALAGRARPHRGRQDYLQGRGGGRGRPERRGPSRYSSPRSGSRRSR